MTGLNLLPTHQRGSLHFTNWTTQADGLASPTALYFYLYHKEENTRLIVSQMSDSQFFQMNMMLQYIHMEGEVFFCQWWQKG